MPILVVGDVSKLDTCFIATNKYRPSYSNTNIIAWVNFGYDLIVIAILFITNFNICEL